MHTLGVLLLTVLSLGTLVPGGVALDLCFCRVLSGSCPSHDRAERGPTPRDCCPGKDARESGAADRQGDCRGCIELNSSEHPRGRTPPPRVSVAVSASLAFVVMQPMPTRHATIPSAVERVHDALATRMNLPLRI